MEVQGDNALRVGLLSITPTQTDDLTKVSDQHLRSIEEAAQCTAVTLIVCVRVNIYALTKETLNEVLVAYYKAVLPLKANRSSNFRILFTFPTKSAKDDVQLSTQHLLLHPPLTHVFQPPEAHLCASENNFNVAAEREQRHIPQLQTLELGPKPGAVLLQDRDIVLPQYDDVVIGGSFDHLHEGHFVLISMAALLAYRELVVGVSVDELLVKKKHRQEIEPYWQRHLNVMRLTAVVNPAIACDCVPLKDMYGPSGVRPNLKAIVVSKETEKGGAMVNEERGRNGVGTLDVVVVGLVQADTDAEKLSSTALRAESTRHLQEQFLLAEWSSLCQRLGGSDSVTKGWFEKLKNLYSEAHRSYHTLTHISHMLKELKEFESNTATQLPHRDALLLAVWFHDAVYEPSRNDNEDRSAELSRQFTQELKLDPQTQTSVFDGIVLTKTHKVPEDAALEQKCLMDLDLCILGQSVTEYEDYSRKIRLEYKHVSAQAYRDKRSQALQSILASEFLFQLPYFRQRYEQRARLNMRREMALLRDEQYLLDFPA